jgi:DNA-directed RNA polymerase subunit beta'
MLGPSQDMVMGNYYLTFAMDGEKGQGMAFKDSTEAITACELGKVSLHARIKAFVSDLRVEINHENIDKAVMVARREQKSHDKAAGKRVIETTAGRCIFNDMLGNEMPFFNLALSQKMISKVWLLL